MRTRDAGELLLLAAIWGGSFLFMRLGAAEFGPFALAGLRVLGASLLLVPLLLRRGEWGHMRRHWRSIAVVGIANSAVPFLCFAYAAQAITGGLSAIFNATTPLWGVLIGWAWLKDRPGHWRLAGLAVGFAGVLWLAWDKADFRPGAGGTHTALAVAACLLATGMYGLAANLTKRHLTGVPPLALATGSQLSATVVLAPLMLWHWPATPPGAVPWAAVVALALLCTGVAYILYFRLIAAIGATHALGVTYLIPAFAIAWGGLFLGETVDATMVGACGLILLGTALVTGLWQPRRPGPAPAA